MDTCLICFEKRRCDQFVRTECGCVACSDCHLQWARSQLDSKARVVLRCPMPQCMAPLTTTDMLLTLDEDTQEQLEEAQTWSFLRSSPDIKACPICNYLGFLSLRQQSYHCEACNKCWQEPVKSWFAPLRSASALSLDLMSQVWKRFFCKQCPSCAAFIQKNEGCKHMECLQCGYEFCWLCYIEWKHHYKRVCSGYIYGLLETVAGVLCFLFVLKMFFLCPAAATVVLWLLWYVAIASGIGLNGFILWLEFDMALDFALVRLHRRGIAKYTSLTTTKLALSLAVEVLAQGFFIFLALQRFWTTVGTITSYGFVLGYLIRQTERGPVD